jgi:protein-S-isoprenylcysteine O-methyltransferase Ste14
MKLEIYLSVVFLLLFIAYFVFRRIVKRAYRDHHKLGAFASFMQLLVFAGYFSFPYLFNPPEWPWFWRQSGLASQAWYLIGLGLLCGGFFVVFGTMTWFGIGKAFGVKVVGLTCKGPYKISRNPQILGGHLLVIGTFMQWPSFYALGWVLMYVLITHWMVKTEEEHLARIFGKDYERYCAEVPRYLFGLNVQKDVSA